MKITLVEPQGFCFGVKSAINAAINALSSDTPRPIYMLGQLVHNKYVIDLLEDAGIIIMTCDIIDAINQIDHGTVIFTAHGVKPNIYTLCQSKGLSIIDTTCKFVKHIHALTKDYLDNDYTVYFLGINNHPEYNGIVGISDRIIPIDFSTNIKYDEKSVIITQSTLNYKQVLDFFKSVPDYVEKVSEVCNASRLRQEAAINQARGHDVCIVVGDKSSNNCRTLSESVRSNTNCIVLQVECFDDLDFDFSKVNSVAITSGASTPNDLVNEIYNKLKLI